MTTAGPDGASGGAHHQAFRMTRARRVGDAVIGVLVKAGLVPHSYLLTTTGRKSGLPRTTPVTLVERDGRRWLVAPYGPVSWVHNARAAGRVSVSRRGRRVDCTVREVTPEEAGPVLKEYLRLTGPPRRYFDAAPDAPAEQFAAEAGRHPVFELTDAPDQP
jgi:deazaflavin-dependent oxidoreductase (nitroreductase family)